MLSALSLGLWHNFGDTDPFQKQRDTVRRAFDLGITQFDLANNYGPPAGSAEENFGRIVAKDLAPYRDDIVVTTKAGYGMQDGPYGEWGSRKYMLNSLDASLERLGMDYVDVFYSHRADPNTPLEETMGALASAVHSGKAHYAALSNYSPARTREAAALLDEMGCPMILHQPSYSMFNRHIENASLVDGVDGQQKESLLDVAGDLGFGVAVFSPLQQGLLTSRYLGGTAPAGSRAARKDSPFLSESTISETYLERARGLNAIAEGRGQTLAQLALAWILRDERITSALVGASSVAQLEDTVKALDAGPLTDEELAAIEPLAVDGTIA
jgi:L-glyceraldehyde 3-phosphate reductase